jgi:hypothetical protein
MSWILNRLNAIFAMGQGARLILLELVLILSLAIAQHATGWHSI